MAYNGWPNYETWNVMLWMDNDYGAYQYYRDCVNEHRRAKQRLTGFAAESICRAYWGDKTRDGVEFASAKIRWGRIAEAMRER